ncbi:MAG TPA: hypothetical protein VLX92_23920 [Kofleriaceae bacterium]|nr:hypothetical protein [Kofleriaceae bacterium]
MSDFQPATEKISIGSLDDTSIGVTAQYNPKELQVDLTVPWSKVNQANNSNTQGIHLEFTGAEGREVTVELLFDGYEQGASVADQVGALQTLASVWKPDSKKENERRPHRCIAKWGSTLSSFRCVIESLSTKYTMFSDKGVPLRATCTVKLKEADVVSMAQGGDASSSSDDSDSGDDGGDDDSGDDGGGYDGDD